MKIVPITPALVLPTEADLKPLYDVAKEYREIAKQAWDHWNAVKQQVFEKEGHEDHSIAAPIAYADPENKRLDAIKKAVCEKMSPILDSVNDKFPGLKLYSPASFLGWGERIERYERSVNMSIESYVEDKFSNANRDNIDDIRARILASKKINMADVKPGMFIYRMYAYSNDLIQIVKLTHNGKRIVAVNPVDNTPAYITPKDRGVPYRINAKLANDIMRFAKVRNAFMAPYRLPKEAKDVA